MLTEQVSWERSLSWAVYLLTNKKGGQHGTDTVEYTVKI